LNSSARLIADGRSSGSCRGALMLEDGLFCCHHIIGILGSQFWRSRYLVGIFIFGQPAAILLNRLQLNLCCTPGR
jgi:hypothetical protein